MVSDYIHSDLSCGTIRKRIKEEELNCYQHQHQHRHLVRSWCLPSTDSYDNERKKESLKLKLDKERTQAQAQTLKPRQMHADGPD